MKMKLSVFDLRHIHQIIQKSHQKFTRAAYPV